MSGAGNLWRKAHGRITKRPTNFSWLVDLELAGSGLPTTYDEFGWVLQQGVKAIVTMTESPLPAGWVRDVDYLHLPTPDLAAPSARDIEAAVGFIHEHIRGRRPVMVHCAAGLGRAGTILACYLIKHGRCTADEAISRIRKTRPRSIQSRAQEIAVSFYAKSVRD